MHPRLFRVAFAWTHSPDAADDLVQETMARALARARQLRNPDALEAWVFRIMANLWRDALRRDANIDDLSHAELTTHESPETVNSRKQTVSRVRAAVGRLPAGYRQTVTLVDIEGFSYAETAAIMDVPVGTVMSRLSRARNRLKELLSGELQSDRALAGASSMRRVK